MFRVHTAAVFRVGILVILGRLAVAPGTVGPPSSHRGSLFPNVRPFERAPWARTRKMWGPSRCEPAIAFTHAPT